MSRRFLLLICWLVSDLLLFIASYALAYFFRVGWILSTDFPFGPYLAIVLLTAPIWLLLLLVTRTFALTRRQTHPRTFLLIASAGIVGGAFFALGYYFTVGLFFSRTLLLIAIVLSILLTILWHIVYERLQRGILRSGHPVFPTLLVGVTRESRELIRQLEENKSPFKPVGIIDPAGAKEKDVAGVPVLGKLNKLDEALVSLSITHLIHASELEQSINLLSLCRERGITYMLLPSVLGIIERNERIDSLEGRAVTIVSPKQAWWNSLFN